MSPSRRTVLALLFVLALLPAWGALPATGADAAPQNVTPAALQAVAQRLTLDLAAQGFEAQSGYVKLYTNEDCEQWSYPIMESCYFNNPAAPYLLPVAPFWPEEYVEPAMVRALGEVKEGYGTIRRFDPREAIVIFGVLPPQADYFGIQTYLFTREGAWDENSLAYRTIAEHFPLHLHTFFTKAPGSGKRIQILASLSNAINNVVIERQSPSHQAFDQFRVFIITPDRYMDNAIRAALGKSSIAAGDIFTEPIPRDMRVGLGEAADDFLTVIRYAMPADETAANAWRANPPLVVLRIRDANAERQPERYPQVQLEERTAAEAPAETALAPDLKDLLIAVGERWNQPCLPDAQGWCEPERLTNFVHLQIPPINLVGPECTEIGMNCLGDTQDTAYQAALRLWLDNGQVYAVAGPLATETGNATYVGLALNSSLKKKGFENIPDDELAGSALAYSSAVSNTEKLFLYYLARDCTGLEDLTGGKCVSIPTTGDKGLPFCANRADPTCELLQIARRDYIRPGTQRGPDAARLLLPVALTLQRPDFAANTIRLPVVFGGE